jgi:tetratricopeptide (TPR) repeat protein
MTSLENSLEYTYKYFNLSNFKLIKFVGPDTSDYLQRQLTNDICQLNVGDSQLTARLDRSGKVITWFILARQDDCFYALVHDSLIDITVEELEKFIIMDDVSIEVLTGVPILCIGPLVENSEYKDHIFEGLFAYEKFKLFLDIDVTTENIGVLGDICKQRAWPWIDQMQIVGKLINETLLFDHAVSSTKGCYLGQETVNKITSGRGAATFPTLVKCGQTIDLVPLKRENRVVGKKINLGKEQECEVLAQPTQDDFTVEKKSQQLYDEAVRLHLENQELESIKVLERALEIYPQNQDAIEILGVIYSQIGEFDKGLEYMDRLLEVDPGSVMAHTNKSFFYMHKGEIEKAEEEKSLATVASFKQYGDIAKEKKAEEEERSKKEAELVEREGMFKQVLEIDPEDTIANYGMAEISFKRKQNEEALLYLQSLFKNNKKHSISYLLMGKIYESMDRKEDAKEIYSQGIDIASAQGEMMPANEMQSRLNKL